MNLISSLDCSAMTQNVALAINMGSPFTGDGLRPIMPNVVRGNYHQGQ